MNCAPHWTAYLSALLTPVIAVLGAWIAYRQWRLGQNKLKLDLFEKRFAVYVGARDLLASIMTSGKAKEEELFRFLSATREAKWLLNDEVATYLDKSLYHRALDLARLRDELEGVGVGEVRSKNVQEQADIKKWFLAQYAVLDEKFTKFMHLAGEA
jgi:hypothetical protein